MQLANFFHLWASGSWHEPLAEYLETLERSGYDGPLTVGIIGSRAEREAAEAAISRPHSSVYAEAGWEQLTLDAARDYSLTHSGAVMYSHTKGAFCQDAIEAPWRRMMLTLVVRDWQMNLERLEAVDAVGCHWLTPEEFPEMTDKPYFGGNFWMARCSYVRTLPPCSRVSRGQAEVWIGRGFPTVTDLRPGWPTYPNQ